MHDKMSKVASKQQRGPEALEKFLRNHPVPVVLGPAGKRYLIDHHHLCCALWKMGIKKCYAGSVGTLLPCLGNLSTLWGSGGHYAVVRITYLQPRHTILMFRSIKPPSIICIWPWRREKLFDRSSSPVLCTVERTLPEGVCLPYGLSNRPGYPSTSWNSAGSHVVVCTTPNA